MNLEILNSNSENKTSWLDKYRPHSFADYYIEKQQLDIVKKWITNFRNNDDNAKPFLILYGTSGVGKTTLAYLILNYYNYEIIECNASDTRTKKTIRETIGQISKVSVCMDDNNKFKKIAIIMDEIDGLSGGESSSVQEIVDIITKDKDSKSSISICPVICTSNNIKDKKLQPLIKNGIILNINKPSFDYCKKLINKISKKEKFKVPKLIKYNIINKSYGDYRQIIMLLFEYYHTIIVEGSIPSRLPIEGSIPSRLPIEGSIPSSSLDLSSNIKYPNSIDFYEECNLHFDIIKKISKECETPLDKINYFLTNKANYEDMSYMCSNDSNLYFMNLYINIIPIISTIQNENILNININTKECLLEYYKLLHTIYNLLKKADLLNNSIFLDKKWDLLDFFDSYGFTLPLQILHNKNITNNSIYIISKFNLCHHTQYNFMRQEQSMIKKKKNIDYVKTHNNDLINIYYNMKRFMFKNDNNIKINNLKNRKKKNISSIDDNRYHIDKIYIKIIEKIDELLS